MTIGQRIKNRRKEMNLTLKDLNNLTNISVGNLSEIENGKYLPSVLALIQLSNTLNCSTDWLLKGSNNSDHTYIQDEIPVYSDVNNEMLNMYSSLDERDQKDISDIINLKYKRNIR